MRFERLESGCIDVIDSDLPSQEAEPRIGAGGLVEPDLARAISHPDDVEAADVVLRIEAGVQVELVEVVAATAVHAGAGFDSEPAALLPVVKIDGARRHCDSCCLGD